MDLHGPGTKPNHCDLTARIGDGGDERNQTNDRRTSRKTRRTENAGSPLNSFMGMVYSGF